MQFFRSEKCQNDKYAHIQSHTFACVVVVTVRNSEVKILTRIAKMRAIHVYSREGKKNLAVY